MPVAIANEIEVLAPTSGEFSQILTPQALEFVAKLTAGSSHVVSSYSPRAPRDRGSSIAAFCPIFCPKRKRSGTPTG